MRFPAFIFIIVSFHPAAFAKEYSLPFDGRWFVTQAGDTPNVNQHIKERSQWYGIDFVKVDGYQNRSPTKSNGKTLDDYYSWGQPVLSPTDGFIRTVVNDKEDNPIGRKDTANAFGNHVVIEAAPDEFVFLAHFQKGSITVKEGDHVIVGQTIGKCGNSGNTDSPHIHIHVQNTPIRYRGMGRNIIFKDIDVELTGKQFTGVTWPLIRGLFVNNSKINNTKQVVTANPSAANEG
jgi:murein DD-endopeptidase MepM/ murein hydrolase activator NlpD